MTFTQRPSIGEITRHLRSRPVPLLAGLLLPVAPTSAGAAPEPTSVFRQDVLDAIDRRIEEAIDDKHIPGGVLWLEHDGFSYCRSYGARSVDPEHTSCQLDTIYDAASLTKVVATAPSIVCLIEDGKLALDDPAARYLPRLAEHGKGEITLRHLLTHTSGLQAVIPRDPAWQGTQAALTIAVESPVLSPPGERFRYSDVNFILLGAIVSEISRLPFDEFAAKRIFRPLSMHDTMFRPPSIVLDRIAPTAREPEGLVHGFVHDPVARLMGGVAGHAGLFLTAPDLARFCRMMLGQKPEPGPSPLRAESIALMTSVQSRSTLTDRRGLGWDIDSSFSAPKGRHFGSRSFGHTGWTGTSVWIDQDSNTFLIFLSNRNHPSEEGRTESLRIDLANLSAQALRSFPRNFNSIEPVLTGIDVLAAEAFSPLDGKSVGLITNHTGLDRAGRSTIDLLHAAPGLRLGALFSPEHGIGGSRDSAVSDSTNEQTGLPVHSLYGETKRPTAAQLQGLDLLVFDIQDIGCRFYTYVSTMGLAMEAAAEHGLGFVVLDRPNPIGGLTVEGPSLAGPESFTAFHRIPVRHGMTAGELARMFKEERGLDLELTVIPLRNWRRSYHFDQTGLAWIHPSPNMRSLDAAVLYPGVGLLEFMKLSVGRGTPDPFQFVGAPGVEADAVSEALNRLDLPGLRFKAARFEPQSSVFAGQACQGLQIEVEDPTAVRSLETGVALATELHRRHPGALDFPQFQRLLQHPPTYEAASELRSLAEIEALWRTDTEAFLKRRRPFLLYGH